MSKREWKPGDVALVRHIRGNEEIALVGEDRHAVATGPHFKYPSGGYDFISSKAHTARPLVVIDPESAKDVERLADLLDRFKNVSVDLDNREPMSVVALHVRRALREFANPTPPKPDEPMGLGAVVEDYFGDPWVRGLSPDVPWFDPTSNDDNRDYGDIDAVRVLSEGFTDD